MWDENKKLYCCKVDYIYNIKCFWGGINMLPVEVVQKQVEFFNNHDIEGFVSTYSKDIQLFR